MPTWAQVAASPPPRIDARLPNKTGFLHLAQELQDQILEYALIEDHEVEICLGGQRGECVTSNTILSLTTVSSKVRRDALDTYTSKNKFRLYFHDNRCYNCDDEQGRSPCCCATILPHVKRVFVVPYHGQLSGGFILGKDDGQWLLQDTPRKPRPCWYGRKLFRYLQLLGPAAPVAGITRDEFSFIKDALWDLEEEIEQADERSWREARSHRWDW